MLVGSRHSSLLLVGRNSTCLRSPCQPVHFTENYHRHVYLEKNERPTGRSWKKGCSEGRKVVDSSLFCAWGNVDFGIFYRCVFNVTTKGLNSQKKLLNKHKTSALLCFRNRQQDCERGLHVLAQRCERSPRNNCLPYLLRHRWRHQKRSNHMLSPGRWWIWKYIHER